MSDYPPGLGPDDPTAGDRAYTDYTDVSFAVKEGSGGEPKIMIEQDEPGLPVLKYGDAFLMLHARDGVSLNDIETLTRQMRDLLAGVSYTKFVT